MSNPTTREEFDPAKRVEALEIAGHTLVGHLPSSYPSQGGNCFSVAVEMLGIRSFMRVLNFGLENLEVALREGYVAWPIKVYPVGDRACLIADERIPKDWYWAKVCSCCAPEGLRSVPDLLQERLQEIRGERTYTTVPAKDGLPEFGIVGSPVGKSGPEWRRVVVREGKPSPLWKMVALGAEQETLVLDRYKLAEAIRESAARHGADAVGAIADDVINQLRAPTLEAPKITASAPAATFAQATAPAGAPKEGDVDPATGEKLAYPCCPGCGHNYFQSPLVPASKRPTGPLCKWCVEEKAGHET